MPWPVYTERFFLVFDSTLTWNWTVPAGQRAVITTVLITPSSAAATTGWVLIGGKQAVKAQVQAGLGSFNVATRLAVYGGEVIGVLMNQSSASIVVGGYLFSNAAAAGDDPPATIESEPPAWLLDELTE